MASAIDATKPIDGLANPAVKLDLRNNLLAAKNEITALQARVLGIGPTASMPTAAAAGVGAMYYDTDLDKPFWSNASSWDDALRGELTGDLDAHNFAIFGNKPKGIIVPGDLTLVAATHNGCVLRCTVPLTLTWNNIGDFACLVYADIAIGLFVTINGTGTNNVTIGGGRCATMLQVTSLTQNVWISTPREIVSA